MEVKDGHLAVGNEKRIDLSGIADASLKSVDIGNLLDRLPAKDALPMLRGFAQKMADKARLTLEVTDFDWVCHAYASSEDEVEPVLCADGLNRSIWNRSKVCDTVNMAGLEIVGGTEGALGWKPSPQKIAVTCEKRIRKEIEIPLKDVTALMSLPRVSWTETFAHTLEVCSQLQMRFVKSTGVFWGQCLERLITGELERGQKYALTIDYDSIFDARDVVRLWQIMEERPDITALCPLQIGRDRDQLLLNLIDEDGKSMERVTTDYFHQEAVRIKNGHFGLTMIRLEHLKDIAHPWFLGVPNEHGRWDENRTDDDIYFWHKLHAAGRTICATPKVRLGHLQLVITWPMDDCAVRHQYLGKYHSDGRPPECMSY